METTPSLRYGCGLHTDTANWTWGIWWSSQSPNCGLIARRQGCICWFCGLTFHQCRPRSTTKRLRTQTSSKPMWANPGWERCHKTTKLQELAWGRFVQREWLHSDAAKVGRTTRSHPRNGWRRAFPWWKSRIRCTCTSWGSGELPRSNENRPFYLSIEGKGRGQYIFI